LHKLFLPLASVFGFLVIGIGGAGAQHGGPEHLGAVNVSMQLVSKLKLTVGASDARSGPIADVTAFGNHAYVNHWLPECPNAGASVVDISDPVNPVRVAYAASHPNQYYTEGAHVIHLNTPSFTGELLIESTEPCDTSKDFPGGLDLWDVTNPRNPILLGRGVGDVTNPDGSTKAKAGQLHSAQGFTLENGRRAYVVITDLDEPTSREVDILDITNPRAPTQVSETGFGAADLPTSPQSALGSDPRPYHHDMQFEVVDGRPTVLLSYWDAGWILLDVSDPARPRFMRESDFPATDPLFGTTPGEGNAHQAFWSSNTKWIVATSEDFSPFRLVGKIQSGPSAGDTFNPNQASIPVKQITPFEPVSGGIGRGRPARDQLPTYYVGLACDPLPRAPGPAIAIAQRGTCTFAVKADNIAAAGYAAGIVFNSAATGNCEAGFGMGGITQRRLPMSSVPRSIGFRILGIQGYNPANCPSGSNPALPAVGAKGADIELDAFFDGWGYVHLLEGSTMRETAQYVVPEAANEKFSLGSGILSVHEVKTDPRPNLNLAYIAYYGAGARVVQFGRNGFQELGRFIDVGGNNFWGTFPHYLGTDPNVRPVQRSDRPLFLLSDRHYGLYILRYTGPEPAPEP